MGVYPSFPGDVSRLFRKALSPFTNLYNLRTGLQQQIPLSYGQPAVYPPKNLINYITAFETNAAVYTVVSAIAQKFGYLPRGVYKIDDQQAAKRYSRYIAQKDVKPYEAAKLIGKAYDDQDTTSDYARLIKNPNPQYGQDSFFEQAAIYYLLTGQCFIWLNRGAVGLDVIGNARRKLKVMEMWIFPAQFMSINVDRLTATGGITGYVFNKAGTYIPYPVEDIIHWKMPNSNYDAFNYSHLFGLSPLSPANKLVTADDAAMDAMVAMHQNDGAKGILFNTTFNKLSVEQKSAMDDVMDNKINNRYQKSSVGALPGEWGYLNMSENAVDMQLLASQDKMLERICNIYKVNHNLFKSGGTYDNLEQARKDFVTQTIMPIACSLRDEMNRALEPSMTNGGTLSQDIDITDLPELQDEMTAQVQALSQTWWLSGNERRQMMNEDESDDPLMDEIWIPNNLTLIDDAAVPSPSLGGFTPGNSQGQIPGGAGGLQADPNGQGAGAGGNGRANPKGNGFPWPASLK